MGPEFSGLNREIQRYFGRRAEDPSDPNYQSDIYRPHMGTYDPRVVWQFWGRAAEASLDRNRSGALFLLSRTALRELLTRLRH
jgi:hypothetical protein